MYFLKKRNYIHTHTQQIQLQTIIKYITVFNMSYKKNIYYYPMIPKIYALPKTHKPGIYIQIIILRIGTPSSNNITKSLAKILTLFQ